MAKTPNKPAAKKPRAPARPGGLAHGRWLRDFPDLSAAELRLVECCARGEVWVPEGWDGKRPTEKTDANTIRAELIRFLALGGDTQHPAHELGVMAFGAWIASKLNLDQSRTIGRLDLCHCHFASTPDLTAAKLPELALSGSQVPSLDADRLRVSGGVFLDDGFIATGPVRLLGSDIRGVLSCIAGIFTAKPGHALIADGIKVAGSVFLRDGFTASGEVRMLNAEISGNLDCTHGTFTNHGGNALSADGLKTTGNVFLNNGFSATGVVRLSGSEILGSLECAKGTFANKEGIALTADRITVKGSLFLRDAAVEGAILLSAASITTLIDDDFNWQTDLQILDGLHYDRIIGPTDAASRIAWLKSQRPDQLDARDWKPQPWEQLIKVLREMGHGYEAGEIAMAKQDHMRKAGIIKGPLRRGFHWLYGLLAGYGHRPVRTVGAMLTVWLACAFFFQIGGSYGYVGPGTPLLNNADLARGVAEQCGHRFETGKTVWTRCSAMPAEYTTFQPLLYSLDLILPLVDLQQDTDWAPIVEDPPGTNLGYDVFLRWLMWFEILFGWAMSLMLVAVLGRLVEKD